MENLNPRTPGAADDIALHHTGLLDTRRTLAAARARPLPAARPPAPILATGPAQVAGLTSVDLFLAATDHAIHCLQLDDTDRRQLFKLVIEPLYRALGTVVDDYYLLFAVGIDRVKATGAPGMPAVAADIRAIGPQMLLARERVREFADALKRDHQDRRLHQFCDRMLALFACTRIAADGRKLTRSDDPVELLDQLGEGLQFRASKGYLVDALRVAKDQLALSWMRLNQTHVSLGFASLY